MLSLVVLSAYSEGPQYAKPPDPLDSILVAVYPNSSSAKLGVLTPVLPQKVYRINIELPHLRMRFLKIFCLRIKL
jgi:hypothetical protein